MEERFQITEIMIPSSIFNNFRADMADLIKRSRPKGHACTKAYHAFTEELIEKYKLGELSGKSGKEGE